MTTAQAMRLRHQYDLAAQRRDDARGNHRLVAATTALGALATFAAFVGMINLGA